MSRTDPRSDAELLAARHDPQAFAVFYQRHVKRVLALCAHKVPADDVGDLVSDVFATALVYRRRFEPSRGTAEAWLAGIASHKAADAHRKGSMQAKTYRLIGGRSLHLDVAELETSIGYDGLTGSLPAEQKRALDARIIQERPYAEIARSERVSVEAVRKRVSRALSVLRARLEAEE
jgi:RNA polymerase sigma factor (sigma-70 family)